MIYTITGKDNQRISSGETMPSNLELGTYTVTVSKGPWPQVEDRYYTLSFSTMQGATWFDRPYDGDIYDRARFECGLARQTEGEMIQLIRRLKATATLEKRRDELGGRRSDGTTRVYAPTKGDDGRWLSASTYAAVEFGFNDAEECNQLCTEHPNELDIFYGND